MAKTSGSTRGGASKSIAESALQKALKISEGGIRHRKTEKLYAYDEKGNVKVEQSGSKKRVSLSYQQVLALKNSVITHNHPSSLRNRYNIGGSFSSADLATAISSDAKEIRAVSGRITFSMKRPKGGWNVNPQEVTRYYNREWKRLKKEMDSYVGTALNKHGYSAYKDAVDRANTVFSHIVNRRVAKKFGLNYTKESNN